MDIFKLFRRTLEAVVTDGAPGGGPQDKGAAPENLIDTAVKPDQSAKPGQAQPSGEQPTGDWFWAEGVKGADKRPDWLKADKYKTVADQAKAYVDAEKKLGELNSKLKGFTGAPEKYELTVPEALKDKLEWLPDDPLLGEFQKLAKEAGMSQQVFEKALHIFAQYEYTNMTPDWAREKTALGERADQRLSDFWEWAGATFDEETATTVKRALGIAPSPAEIFLALEAVRSGTRQPAINKPGEDVRSGPTNVADVDRKYRTVDPATKRALIDTPEGLKAYRAELAQIVGTGDHKVVVGQRKAS